jgi:hypothetical protein
MVTTLPPNPKATTAAAGLLYRRPRLSFAPTAAACPSAGSEAAGAAFGTEVATLGGSSTISGLVSVTNEVSTLWLTSGLDALAPTPSGNPPDAAGAGAAPGCKLAIGTYPCGVAIIPGGGAFLPLGTGALVFKLLDATLAGAASRAGENGDMGTPAGTEDGSEPEG